MNSYHQNLKQQRESTNIISCSWSIFYKGEYISGANYNGVEIMQVVFPCGLEFYSKSLDSCKRRIRQYKKAV